MAKLELHIVRQFTKTNDLSPTPDAGKEEIRINLEIEDERAPHALLQLHEAMSCSTIGFMTDHHAPERFDIGQEMMRLHGSRRLT